MFSVITLKVSHIYGFLYYRYRAFIFTLTFFLYASFHLSRKPISIVKVSKVKLLFKHPSIVIKQGSSHLFQCFLL